MTNQMERILGGPIGYDHTIPGTVLIAGKEFVYFSDDGKNPVRKQFSLLTHSTASPLAQHGGVTSQGCSLKLPDGSVFHAISYHGDIAGWRADIEEGARSRKLQLARVDEDAIVVADGRRFLLKDCIAVFG
jgi:hypothetical protein